MPIIPARIAALFSRREETTKQATQIAAVAQTGLTILADNPTLEPVFTIMGDKVRHNGRDGKRFLSALHRQPCARGLASATFAQAVETMVHNVNGAGLGRFSQTTFDTPKGPVTHFISQARAAELKAD